ncbi:MAG: hypothetical protein KR126chlam1_00095 [Chlamydiae bacterium]|nr:hypothetical protein [Chlamydiota bacterium]
MTPVKSQYQLSDKKSLLNGEQYMNSNPENDMLVQ